MPQEDTELMLISEVAKITGVSVNTIRAWARQGRLDPASRRLTKRGVAWYTTPSAVQKALDKRPTTGRPVKIRA